MQTVSMMPDARSTQAYWRLPVPEKLECQMARLPGHLVWHLNVSQVPKSFVRRNSDPGRESAVMWRMESRAGNGRLLPVFTTG